MNSTRNGQTQAKATNFSLAFQQMASFVAIAKTRNPSEVRDALILECFILHPKQRFSTANDFAQTITSTFGVEIPVRQLELSLRTLTKKGTITELAGGHLAPSATTQKQLEDRLLGARRLELQVKTQWLEQIHSKYPSIPLDMAWEALRNYLTQVFRRHGIQAVALLDQSMEMGADYSQSLASLLQGIIEKRFPKEDRQAARETLASFCATINLDRQRAHYIALLADGAFNYFSLTVPPEVSKELRKKLSSLTLFLDTNFLFGILDLHVHPQVDVSAELLDAVKQFNLPFKLSYHDATVRETQNTLYHFEAQLKRLKWPQSISRAASESGSLTGIELRYHQRNAAQRLDVDDFFAPLRHWQILLKDKGINVYKVLSTPEELKSRATLEAEYREFLNANGKEKPDDAIQHDMAVLDTVRRLRSQAKSTLEAGALLVTCDYYLFRFDWESCRADGKHTSTVLPNLLWQVLRPYVTNSAEFDKAFAETFALPEFGAFGGGAAMAASKMLSIMAGYRDLPEQTAAKMLSNDLLISQLQTATSDQQFQEIVDSAIAAENVTLVEEKAALAKQLELEKASKVEREKQVELASVTIRQKNDLLSRSETSLLQQSKAIQSLEAEKEAERRRAAEAVEKLVFEKREKEAAHQEAKKHLADKEAAEKRAATAITGVGLLAAALFEISVNLVFPWKWLIAHQNSYGVQSCFSAMIFFAIVGTGVKKWRKFCWGIACLGILLVLFQILGGPSLKP